MVVVHSTNDSWGYVLQIAVQREKDAPLKHSG